MDWAEGGGERERAGNSTLWPFPEENLTIKNLSLSFGEKRLLVEGEVGLGIL